jgi:hypothetical protein
LTLLRGFESILVLFGKTNGLVADIVDRVQFPEKRVTEDGKMTHRLGKVHPQERRDAEALKRTLNPRDI